MIKIYLAQLKPRIGDIENNCKIMENHYIQATVQSSDVCLFPELFTTGYIPHDLLLQKSFIAKLESTLTKLIHKTKGTTLLIPTPILHEDNLYNGVIAARNGKIVGQSYKTHLPNYSIFDEKRYFTPGKSSIIELANGLKIGVPICEDIWHKDVCKELKNMGAEVLLVPNASPYEVNKFEQRIKQVSQRFDENNIPIVYCNQVLGHDGIIFDGKSFVYNGGITNILKSFEEDVVIIDLKYTPTNSVKDTVNINQDLYSAMLLGTKDYILQNRFSNVILGLSGGIDSALVACIAVDSLGPENVTAVMMPSIFNSKSSFDDANILIQNLGINSKTIPISKILNAANMELQSYYGKISSVAYQNLQARIRGMILMSISNTDGSLLLTTGNKSEIAVGYSTLYGDMCGAFNPIKDLYKTQVYEIARYINSSRNLIPESILIKPPSAELSFNQKDSDTLPEYELLDRILHLHIEQNLGFSEIIELGYESNLVFRILYLVKNNEFKRQQSAPGVRLSSKSFNKDRRLPIQNSNPL